MHPSLELQPRAIGANLNGATSLGIQATGGSWSLPLAITGQSSVMTG